MSADYDDELIANIGRVIEAELERQSKYSVGPCGDEEIVVLNTLKLSPIAEAVAAIFVDKQGDCSWCHNPCAVDGWKLPLDTADPVETRDN